jgi:hypothetical protein
MIWEDVCARPSLQNLPFRSMVDGKAAPVEAKPKEIIR